jgi:hypothetical protein
MSDFCEKRPMKAPSGTMDILRRIAGGWRCLGLAFGLAVSASAVPAADPLPSTGNPRRVDAALEADLLQGLGDLKLPPARQNAPAPAEPAPPVDAPSPEELRGLLEQEGEDLGSKGESPTQRIGSMMRSVEERFVSKDSSQATQQLQEDIVTQLRAMLEQQKKKCSQCSGGECDSPGSSSSSGSKPSGSKPGESKSPPKPGSPDEPGKEPGDPKQSPDAESDAPSNPGEATDPQASSAPGATDSEDRLDPSRLEEVLRRSAADFDELWGQLPPQVQQRLKQGLTERTLPQYEPMIEAYYRRLAEDSGEAR